MHFFYFTPIDASALMDKYVTSYYIMLHCGPHFLKTILSLQIYLIWADCKYVDRREMTKFLLISLLFLSPPAFPNTLLKLSKMTKFE